MSYAIAYLKGNYLAPKLEGKVELFPWRDGTLVKVEVANLPIMEPATKKEPPIGPFAFHIHEGKTCNNLNNDFKSALKHFNPENKPHPFHAGDLPSLFSNDGYAFMIVFTNCFKPIDVIERAIIIHQNPDDYKTQPSGNAGPRIACGIIKKN